MDSSHASVRLADGLSREYLLHHRMVPKGFDASGRLIVALAPNAIPEGIDDVAFAYRAEAVVEQASWEEVERLITRLATAADREIELAQPSEADPDDLTSDARDLANQPPVVRYVNLLVREAYDVGASDIHLEATRSGVVARFRLDGALVPAPEPPAGLHHAIVSRIKLLAEGDIAERRRPQDGRIQVRLDSRDLDLRVSTVPTLFGESVVLRLLDRGGRPVGLDELGMSHAALRSVTAISSRPNGMLLVTGPTGSGKTTTLYAALQQRSTATEKIITVEDPIEYQLPGITQVPVHREAGVAFASALRSLLRQDPDVLMIGEMRDGETAELGIQAAMTGHFVFTTLHTNDAVSAVPRLTDLGIPAYLIAATVEAVLAQRLVRRICNACRASYAPRPEVVAAVAGRPVGRVELQRGTGCPACRGTGYRGRLGLFELLVMSDALKDAITRSAARSELRDQALADGTTLLREDGWSKVEAGLTTVEEVLRVV